MYRPKKDYVLILLVGVLFLLGGIALGLSLRSDKVLENDTEVNVSEKKSEKEESNISTNKTDNNSNVNTSNNNTNISNTNSSNTNTSSTNKPSNSGSTNNTVNYSNKDLSVINTFNNTLDEVSNSKNDESFGVKAKGTFVNIVDFLFYDGSIKGVTFKELTDKGKEKVLEIASKIDNMIESKMPGYKESIASGCGKAFNAMSDLIKKGANNVNEFLISNLDKDDYNSLIDAKNELVLYTKNAFSFIGDVGSNIINSTKDKLNKWYLEWREK